MAITWPILVKSFYKVKPFFMPSEKRWLRMKIIQGSSWQWDLISSESVKWRKKCIFVHFQILLALPYYAGKQDSVFQR